MDRAGIKLHVWVESGHAYQLEDIRVNTVFLKMLLVKITDI